MSKLVILQLKAQAHSHFTKRVTTAFTIHSTYKKPDYQTRSFIAFQLLILKNKQKPAYVKSSAAPNIAIVPKDLGSIRLRFFNMKNSTMY